MSINIENESRQLIAHYQDLKKRIEISHNQQNMIHSNILNIENSINKIESIRYKDDIDTMFPLGSGCFIDIKIPKQITKILVNIGSGICVKKNIFETINYLTNKKEQLKNISEDITKSINTMIKNLGNIEAKLNEINSFKEN